jgi:hypothetical protein
MPYAGLWVLLGTNLNVHAKPEMLLYKTQSSSDKHFNHSNHTNTDTYYNNLWNFFEYLMKDRKTLAIFYMYRMFILNISQCYEQ